MNKVERYSMLIMIILFINSILYNDLIFCVIGIQILQLTFILEILKGDSNE